MKIAVFGGSFDPPHLGHVQIVTQALQTLDIDKIFLVPTYLNPFKKEFFAPENKRHEWLCKLFKNNDKVEILDFEITQQRAVPTIETVEFLKKSFPLEKIYLIIGADNFLHVNKWHRFSELEKSVEFVVATRDAINLPKDLKKLSINVNISSSKLREEMDTSFIPKTIENDVKKYYQGIKWKKE